MGLMHLFALGPATIGYDLNPVRRAWAAAKGFEARDPAEFVPADTIFVCPGSQAALDLAIAHVRPGGTIVLFAPQPPEQRTTIDANRLYFSDIALRHAYSCGPDDTHRAADWLASGLLRAEDVVSDFIDLADLPGAYRAMKQGQILKPMVVWPSS
jgi:L-iditol 2-dehydrogenase